MEILTFQDLKTTPDIIHEYTSFLKENNVPIIIDNGNLILRILKTI